MRERNWLMIGLGLFLVVFIGVVYTNAWLGYEELRVDHSIWYDPDVQRGILLIGIPLVIIGVILVVIGWNGPEVRVDRRGGGG